MSGPEDEFEPLSDKEFLEQHEGTLISKGWSITVGDLRRAIDGVPDDYEVMLENAEVGDIEIANVNIEALLPPSATGSPGLMILGGGQILNSEYDYDNRLDAHMELGGDKYWDDKQQEWRDRRDYGPFEKEDET